MKSMITENTETVVVPSMPTEGQFVAVWEYKGRIWSDTFKYNKQGKLVRLRWADINCSWESCEESAILNNELKLDIRYFTMIF